jgi:tetratricopeptide (TPR) repeat protein
MYLEKKEYAKAFPFFQKTLQIREKCLPANHPLLASVYNSIGLYHQNIGNCPTAISFHRKTLTIHEESAVPNYPELAIIYNNIAYAFEGLYEYQKAINIANDTMEAHDSRLRMFHDHLDIFLLKVLYLLYILN